MDRQSSYRSRDPSPLRGSSVDRQSSYRTRDPSPLRATTGDSQSSYRTRDPSPLRGSSVDTHSSYSTREPSTFRSASVDRQSSYRTRDPSPLRGASVDRQSSYRTRDASPLRSSSIERQSSYRTRDASPLRSSSIERQSSYRTRDASPLRGSSIERQSSYRTRDPSPLRASTGDSQTSYKKRDPSPSKDQNQDTTTGYYKSSYDRFTRRLDSILEGRKSSRGSSVENKTASTHTKPSEENKRNRTVISEERTTGTSRKSLDEKQPYKSYRCASADRTTSVKKSSTDEASLEKKKTSVSSEKSSKEQEKSKAKKAEKDTPSKPDKTLIRRYSVESDVTGIRSIYARALAKSAESYQRIFSGSGGRTTQSSTYRPLVYTPGSPSPLRRSWSGFHTDKSDKDKSDKTDKMSSFMAIGRNSVFPDLTSSRTGTGRSTYPESDFNFDSARYKTFRLPGHNNNVNNNTARPYTATGLTSRSTSPSSGSTRPSTPANGNGSRNIYRQPASATTSRLRNQTADLRRKYFSQRHMWYSEADGNQQQESSDVATQRRHSSVDVSPDTAAKQDSSATKDPVGPKQQKPPKFVSILKRSSVDLDDKNADLDSRYGRKGRDGSPASGGSRPRRASIATTKDAKTQQLKARFKDDVAIVYYDQEEKTTAVRSTETVPKQEKLKDDKSSSSLVTEGSVRIRCSLHPGEPCSHGNVAFGPPRMPEPTDTNRTTNIDEQNMTIDQKLPSRLQQIDVESSMLSKAVFKDKIVDITTDDQGQNHLKVVVPIGSDFIRNRTSVKATSGGKRLIVIAYRCQGKGEEAHVHQYVEKMTVPHPIDAYSVRATMDKEGNLKITAPMLCYEQNVAMTRIASER